MKMVYTSTYYKFLTCFVHLMHCFITYVIYYFPGDFSNNGFEFNKIIDDFV